MNSAFDSLPAKEDRLGGAWGGNEVEGKFAVGAFVFGLTHTRISSRS